MLLVTGNMFKLSKKKKREISVLQIVSSFLNDVYGLAKRMFHSK